MKAIPPAKARKQSRQGVGRATLASPLELQQRYEKATTSLQPHVPQIDAWLCEHEPDLWRDIRQEDDELFRLRQLGVSESRYQTRLDTFIALCKHAERLYCEAQPSTLRLPPLAEGERVAVYYAFADGELRKADTAAD